MGDFVKVGDVDDFRGGRGRAVSLDGVGVAIFKTRAGFVAFTDACPHMGASLADGRLTGNKVECAWHGWTYDVRTGECETKEWACLRVYEVKVEGREVLLRRPDPEPPAEEPPDDDWIALDPDRHFKKPGS